MEQCIWRLFGIVIFHPNGGILGGRTAERLARLLRTGRPAQILESKETPGRDFGGHGILVGQGLSSKLSCPCEILRVHQLNLVAKLANNVVYSLMLLGAGFLGCHRLCSHEDIDMIFIKLNKEQRFAFGFFSSRLNSFNVCRV